MCITAIGNLMQTSIKEGNPRFTFSKEKEIIPFIEAHWDGMTTTPRRVTQSWHLTVSEIQWRNNWNIAIYLPVVLDTMIWKTCKLNNSNILMW
jgi:hypothetical protein